MLHYRGNYPKDVTGIREYDEGRKFDLFIGKSGNRQIELSSTEFGLLQIWVNLVKEMLVKSIEQGKSCKGMFVWSGLYQMQAIKTENFISFRRLPRET